MKIRSLKYSLLTSTLLLFSTTFSWGMNEEKKDELESNAEKPKGLKLPLSVGTKGEATQDSPALVSPRLLGKDGNRSSRSHRSSSLLSTRLQKEVKSEEIISESQRVEVDPSLLTPRTPQKTLGGLSSEIVITR